MIIGPYKTKRGGPSTKNASSQGSVLSRRADKPDLQGRHHLHGRSHDLGRSIHGNVCLLFGVPVLSSVGFADHVYIRVPHQIPKTEIYDVSAVVLLIHPLAKYLSYSFSWSKRSARNRLTT